MRFSISVTLNLLGKESKILHIVFLFQFSFMHCYQILLLFLPIELLTFKFTRILDLLAFLLESLMGQIVDLLNIMHILLTLMLRVVVDFEWSLRSHEVWVRL